jgi:mitochondrial FAD-linked sulfhydryl oxidase
MSRRLPGLEVWDWPEMPRRQWGPIAWGWLHRVAEEYPDRPTKAEANNAGLRLKNFFDGLPCPECKKHAYRYLLRNPPDLSGNEAFRMWAWRFHNAVNARLGKRLVAFR